MSQSSKKIDAADVELAEMNKLVMAGDAYRKTLVLRPDGTLNGYPFWHGWAIMDAFIAGATHAKKDKTK